MPLEILRNPPAETEEYPGLVVHDDRQVGSITFGHSRLPIWCIIGDAITSNWSEVDSNWPSLKENHWDANRFSEFLYYLTEMRGEFARLLCVLADAERREDQTEYQGDTTPWWKDPEQQKRVADQLKKCLATLE